VKPPNSAPTGPLQSDIRKIDELFSVAGLVRNRRGKPAQIAPKLLGNQATPEELSVASSEPNRAVNGVRWLSVPGWEKYDWLWQGFSTRRGGASAIYCPEGADPELNLGFTPDDSREIVLKNRRLLAEAITGEPETPLITLRQFHSNLSAVVADSALHPELPSKGDGLITAQPGRLLAVQTADCIPVLVADRKRRVVGAFHAGWRGTVKRIVELGVGRMRLEFGSKPQDLIAAIGPGIGPCCYPVGEEVLSSFESQFIYAQALFHEVFDTDPVRTKYPMLFLTQRAPGHSPIGPRLHLDLVEANRRQLLDAGLKPGAIKAVGGCTNCQPDLFFSHRRSHGRAGRMMSVIGIRPS
jgi:YfiH family protein